MFGEWVIIHNLLPVLPEKHGCCEDGANYVGMRRTINFHGRLVVRVRLNDMFESCSDEGELLMIGGIDHGNARGFL